MTAEEISLQTKQIELIPIMSKTPKKKWLIAVCCLGIFVIAGLSATSVLLYRQMVALSNSNAALQQEYGNHLNKSQNEIEQLSNDLSNLKKVKRTMLSSEIIKEDLLGSYTSLGFSGDLCRKTYKLTINEDSLDLALCLDQYCFEKSEIASFDWWPEGTSGIMAIAKELTQHSPRHYFDTVILGNYNIALISYNEEFANGLDVFYKEIDWKNFDP